MQSDCRGRWSAPWSRCSRPPPLSSCAGSDGDSGVGTELTFFIFNEPSGAYQEAAAKCSEDSNGDYTISFEFLPAQADAQREQLVRRLGAEDDSIDIIGMDVIWTAEFANAGLIEPWEGADADAGDRERLRLVVEAASFEGTSTRRRSPPTPSCSGTARTASTSLRRPGRT